MDMPAKTTKKSATKPVVKHSDKATVKKKEVSKKETSIIFSGQKEISKCVRLLNSRLHFFKGNILIFITLVIFGVFIPPLLAVSAIYFVYNSTTKKPRLFDRHIIIFFIVIFLYQFFARIIEGYVFDQIILRVLQTTALATVLFYPFVFFWLWFDYTYVKKQKDYEQKK